MGKSRNYQNAPADVYVVAVYSPPMLLDPGDGESEGQKMHFIEVGVRILVAFANFIQIKDKKSRRMYLVTPGYSGEPRLTSDLHEAFKFRSLNVAKDAGRETGADFEVLAVSNLT